MNSMSEKKYTCNQCDFASNFFLEYKGHLRKHAREKALASSVSQQPPPKPEPSKSALKGRKRFVCSVCGKELPQRFHLERHMRTHTGEKIVRTGEPRFVCAVCDKRFWESSNLNRHMIVHSGARPYNCHLCGHEFSLMGNLRRHLRTHTFERPHVCLLCGEAFTLPSQLKTHMENEHKEESYYRCYLGWQGFSHVCYRKGNPASHAFKLPHICGHCNKEFSESSHLKKHMEVHIRGTDNTSCQLCVRGYLRLNDLRNHLALHSQGALIAQEAVIAPQD